MDKFDDFYLREEKNPAKRKSGWSIVMKYLAPIIAAALVGLLFFQFFTLTKVHEVIATEPDREVDIPGSSDSIDAGITEGEAAN